MRLYGRPVVLPQTIGGHTALLTRVAPGRALAPPSARGNRGPKVVPTFVPTPKPD